MARREDFDNSLWSDPDFLALSSDARLVYIWTWTNPRCGMAGIYKLAPSMAALETGLSQDRVMAALDELGAAEFTFYENRVLWVRTRVKHLRQKTFPIAKSIRNDLLKIPDDHPLKARFLATYGHHSWLSDCIGSEGHVTLNRPSPDSLKTLPQGSDGHVTVPGTGTGRGTGRRSMRCVARDSQRYTPDPEMVAMRDAHFPDLEVGTVASAATTLRFRKREVTPEAIRALLDGPGVAA